MVVHSDSSESVISVVPADEASWADLQTVFGTRGQAIRCQCQRYKLPGFTEVSHPTLRRLVMRIDF